MKEELNVLRETAIQTVKAREEFEKNREFFNMKVEEKIVELNMEVKRDFLDYCDYYEDAKVLNIILPIVPELISKIREEHPKYGNKRIKELVIKQLQEDSTIIPADMNEFFDYYFIYESCGFFKLLEQDLKLNNLKDETIESTKAIFNEAQDTVIKVGTSITGIVKPYGEVAKSQLGEAEKATKKVINKGSKKLMRLLKNIEEKTEQ